MRAGADESAANALQAMQALSPKLRVARRGATEAWARLQPIQSCSARSHRPLRMAQYTFQITEVFTKVLLSFLRVSSGLGTALGDLH